MNSQERRALFALRLLVVAGFVVGVFCLYVLDWQEGLFISLGAGGLVAILLRLTVFR